MMSAPASKRRKIAADDASALGSECGDDCGPTSLWAGLPVTAWGHALDYLRYSEVRSALLVSKTMASEVPKYVQTLNVFSAAEMHVRTARRFSNCAELNILCLLLQDREDPEDFILVEDVVHRIVPFLTFFCKLKGVFLGGVWKGPYEDSPTLEFSHYEVYSQNVCVSPENHDSLYRYLVHSIAGLYDSGALMPHVSIEGIRSGTKYCCAEGACVCGKIGKSFPFGAVIPSASSEYEYFEEDFLFGTFSCLPINERRDIIKGRAGGLEYLRSLTCNLEASLCLLSSVHERAGRKKAQIVHYLDKHNVQYIEKLIEGGCDPGALVRKRVVDQLRRYRRTEKNSRLLVEHFVARTTVDQLVAWGFPVEEGDFRILDAELIPYLEYLYTAGRQI